jgi:hypothetical protein
MKTGIACFFEISLTVSHTIHRRIEGDSNLCTHCRDNLKSLSYSVRETDLFVYVLCVLNSVRIANIQLLWVTLFHYRREFIWRNAVQQLGCQVIDNFSCVSEKRGSCASGKIVGKNIIVIEFPEIWVSRQGFIWEYSRPAFSFRNYSSLKYRIFMNEIKSVMVLLKREIVIRRHIRFSHRTD